MVALRQTPRAFIVEETLDTIAFVDLPARCLQSTLDSAFGLQFSFEFAEMLLVNFFKMLNVLRDEGKTSTVEISLLLFPFFEERRTLTLE